MLRKQVSFCTSIDFFLLDLVSDSEELVIYSGINLLLSCYYKKLYSFPSFK